MFSKYLEWTEQAIDCYNIGCICHKCSINSVMNAGNRKCRMKATVIELVRRFGKPKQVENKEDKLDVEAIKKLIREGLSILEISKFYKIDIKKLRNFNHAHGLFRREISAMRKLGRD